MDENKYFPYNNREISWIDFNDINVFFVADGGIESILDEDLKLIKAEEIDGISTVLNEEFDKLLELEE